MHTCEPRHFLQSCLLLLLRERASHGYELVERLEARGLADADPAGVYRALRISERDGLTRSTWCPSAAGPARRTYHLTPAGLAALERVVIDLTQTRNALDSYLRHVDVTPVGSL